MAPSSSTAAMFLAVLVCLVAASLKLLPVHGQGQQLDPPGFISIDCGYADGLSYPDSLSKLAYVSDAGFVDAGDGINAAVSPQYVPDGRANRYNNVRYFQATSGGGAGTRSCYTLPVAQGSRNLIRATFYYGNYDGRNTRPVVFDLHLGVNRWATVNVTSANGVYIFEAVAVSPVDFMQVCLVNMGLGTPFISGLELRPLSATMYQEATVNQSLFLLTLSRPSARFNFSRYQFNPDYSVPPYRYPDDSYDRLWQRYGRNAAWTSINTTKEVDVSNATSSFDKPSGILQNAATLHRYFTQVPYWYRIRVRYSDTRYASDTRIGEVSEY